MSQESFRSPSSLNRRTALGGIGAGAAALGLGHLNRAAAQDATPDAMATPSAANVELADLIRETERERLRAFVEADIDILEPLHADDFQLINPGGGAATKEEYLGGVASGVIDYLVWEPDSEIAVRLYDGAAAIRYRANTEIVVDGEKLILQTWHTDVYEQRDGQWQVVWSHATAVE